MYNQQITVLNRWTADKWQQLSTSNWFSVTVLVSNRKLVACCQLSAVRWFVGYTLRL